MCSVFAHGDMDGFERAVRRMIEDVHTIDPTELSTIARAEAERLFSPPTVAARLLEELEAACRS